MIDRLFFFRAVRKSFGPISSKQVQGFDAILDEWEIQKLIDARWLAYMLATSWHETAKTMQPIEEYGKGRGHRYGKPDPVTGQIYYGRGFVQLTWDYNYKKISNLLFGDLRLFDHPGAVLEMKTSIQVLFKGMTSGLFTGRKLANYFNDATDDPLNARRIINGMDRAERISIYHQHFLASIKKGAA